MTDTAPDLTFRVADRKDLDTIWPIFQPIVSAGDTYAFPPDTDREGCGRIWIDQPQQTFVAEAAGTVLGTYYIKPNAAGPGGHVCNCGYMVSPQARGRGVAAAMCQHSQEIARSLGYRMMQFNAVVSTNEGAVRLWHRLGFETVGRVPRAFHHPTLGFVDSFVMVKWLDSTAE